MHLRSTINSIQLTPTQMKNSPTAARGRFCILKRAFSLMLRLVWLFLHLVLKIWCFVLDTIHTLHGYLISTGFLKKYKNPDLTKLQYLAIVIESQEAYDIARVVKLLRWLSKIGVKHICLYDMDGVMKRYKANILKELKDSRFWHLEGDGNASLPDETQTTLGFLSFTDSKEGTAKAASFLCKKYLEVSDFREGEKPILTEEIMAKALTAVGCGGLQPNLLLVYGPVRCHLGFPAWRMRYTEIVHMGTLRSMKYGAVVKAIHTFLSVPQNYGT